MRELEAVLGRLCFAMAPLEHLRPFLAPIYAWVAAVGSSIGYSRAASSRGPLRVPLPWSLRFLFTYLAEKLSGDGRTTIVRPLSRTLGTAFRADAKAEGQTFVVGGWECLGGTPPSRARWFSLRLDRRSAPWAYARGEPFRTVAALELFATLLSFMAFAPNWPAASSGTIGLTGLTDNLGNTFAVSRLMTSKFPSVVILAELAEQLKRRQTERSLLWVPRDQNEEADELTNEEFGRFQQDLRVDIIFEKVEWIVLDKMMVAAEAIYGVVKAARGLREGMAGGSAGGGARGRRRPGERLRTRDPW
jgi:hypothetical protein